jgi:hypothetical protein
MDDLNKSLFTCASYNAAKAAIKKGTWAIADC